MAKEIIHTISPLNDIGRTFFVEHIDDTGAVVPTTTGTITGFLAETKASDAGPFDDTLTAPLTHVGSDEEGALYPPGTWLWELDGELMTHEIFDGVKDGTFFYIIVESAGVRVYEKVKFLEGRPATIA